MYDSLKEHILSEEILTENNYPLQHPEKSGSAILYREDYKKGITDREYSMTHCSVYIAE